MSKNLDETVCLHSEKRDGWIREVVEKRVYLDCRWLQQPTFSGQLIGPVIAQKEVVTRIHRSPMISTDETADSFCQMCQEEKN